MSYTSACQILQESLSTTLGELRFEISDLWRYRLDHVSWRHSAGLGKFAIGSVSRRSAGSISRAPVAREYRLFARLDSVRSLLMPVIDTYKWNSARHSCNSQSPTARRSGRSITHQARLLRLARWTPASPIRGQAPQRQPLYFSKQAGGITLAHRFAHGSIYNVPEVGFHA